MDVFQLPGILRKRWIYVLVPMLAFVGLAAAYVVVVKPTVPVTAEIFLDTQGLVAEQSDLVPQIAAQNQDSAILESQIYVMQSSEILSDVVDKLDLTKDTFLYRGKLPKDLAKAATMVAIQKHLTIERAGQSFILDMTFKHVDPAKGAEIANTIAAVYLKKIHEARSDASNRASGAFEMQATALAARVRKAETELEAFKASHDLVSTGQQGLVIDQQVEGVNKQLIAARTDLGIKRASYEQARSLTAGSVMDGAIPEALASTALGSMRARYADLVASMNELSSALGANHPQMKAARSQVAAMRLSIEQEIARIRQSLQSGMERSEASVKSLEGRLTELTKSSLDTSEAGIKARELQSEVDTLRALYKAFLSRSQELGQRDTVNINNSRIISKAIGVGSSSMLAKLMIIVAATLFGIAAGSGIAVLRELAGRMLTRRTTAVQEDDSEPAPLAVTNQPRPAPMRGVSNAVDKLLEMHRPSETSTIILLSPDNDNSSPNILPQIANALYRHSKDVLYSSGEGAGISDRNEAADAVLGDILKFIRLSPTPSRVTDRSGPTFRNFAHRHKKADYVIIDARGHAAKRYLAELLAEANGILVLADDSDGQKKIDRFVKSLDPFKDRMLGTLIVGSAG
jgi:succinoglycan biosynthesis transport protein ExoP